MKLPRSLGEYRKLSGRTQVDYAEQANVSVSTWKFWEAGNKTDVRTAASLKADLIDQRDLIDEMIVELQGVIDLSA